MKIKILIIVFIVFSGPFLMKGLNMKSEENGNFTEKERIALLAERGKIIKLNYDGDIILSEKEIYKKYKNENSVFEKIKYKDYNYLFFLMDFTYYGSSKKRLEGWYNYTGNEEWVRFIEYRIYDKWEIKGFFDKEKGKYIIIDNSDDLSKGKEVLSLLLDEP